VWAVKPKRLAGFAVFDPHSKASVYDIEWKSFKGAHRRLLDRA